MFGNLGTNSTTEKKEEEETFQLLEIKHALEQEKAERAEMESRLIEERLKMESRLNELEKLLVSQHPKKSTSQASSAEGLDLFADNPQNAVPSSKTMNELKEEEGKETLPLSSRDEKGKMKMKLTEDIFSLMMISPLCSSAYFLGIFTCAFQVVLAFDYILSFVRFFQDGQDDSTEYGFDIPVNVTRNVRFGQYCVALLSIWLQTDILISIQNLFAFRKGTENYEILRQNQDIRPNSVPTIHPGNELRLKSHSIQMIGFRSIYFPNILRFLQGAVVIIMLMILIIQNNDFIELLMNFTALFVISEIDDIVFQVLKRGYFCGFHTAKIAAKIESIEFVEERKSEKCCYRTSYFTRSLILGIMNIGMIAYVFIVAKLQASGYFLHITYPLCKIPEPELIGNGKCHGGEYNTEECGFDGGDCIEFNTKYPNCTVYNPEYIGNRICDGWIYNTEECGFDGEDCIDFNTNYPNCTVDYPYRIGDGECNSGSYNTEKCGWDGGDCIEFNTKYPNCKVYNPSSIGNGVCRGGEYNSEECGWDGGDCLIAEYPECHVDKPYRIGNGFCSGWEYNTEECGFDGGDCIEFNEKYPDCTVSLPFRFGDGVCRGGEYNTEECGFDGGDCADFNTNYPNCNVDEPNWIGDGFCNGGEYNTKECGFDEGDCIVFNTKYPNCKVDYPYKVGDGFCNGGEYNTEECGFDEGDCN